MKRIGMLAVIVSLFLLISGKGYAQVEIKDFGSINVTYTGGTLYFTVGVTSPINAGAKVYLLPAGGTPATGYRWVWTMSSGAVHSESFQYTFAANPSTNYTYQVQVEYNNGAWLRSTTQSIPLLVCTTPTLFQPQVNANGAVGLSWSAPVSGGTTKFTLQYKTASATTWTSVGPLGGAGYTTPPLSPSTYNWRVQSSCLMSTAPFQQYQHSYINGANFTVTPLPPSNLVLGNNGYRSAQISWGAVAGASQYNVQYKLTSATAWTAAGTSTTTSYTFPVGTFQPGTGYDVRVQSVVNGIASATFARTASVPSFTTLACTAAPVLSAIPAGNVGLTKAVVSWTGGTGNYYLQFKERSIATWSGSIAVSGTAYTFAGLRAGTIYDYRVQSRCINAAIAGDEGQSGFVQGSFTTNACAVPSSISGSESYIGGSIIEAELWWPASQGATSYNLTYTNNSVAPYVWTNIPGAIAGTGYVMNLPRSYTGSYLVGISANCQSAIAGDIVTTGYNTQYLCGPPPDYNPIPCYYPISRSGCVASTQSQATVTANAATVKWRTTTNYDAAPFDLEYRLVGTSQWNRIYGLNPARQTIPTTTCRPHPCHCGRPDICTTTYEYEFAYTIGGLLPGRQYEWAVRGWNRSSVPNTQSAYCGYYNFTTAAAARMANPITAAASKAANNVVPVTKNVDPLPGKTSIMPNPANNMADVIFAAPVSGKVAFTVYDMNGRIVLNEEKQVVKGQVNYRLNTSLYKSGTYIVSIHGVNLVENLKMVIAH